MHILLVEDSPTQAALTTRDLQNLSSQLKVEHVTLLHEALSLALHRRFDLIVLDVTLPDGNGLELCRTLKANETTRRTPVVMFSAERLSDLRRDSYDAGAEYCVSKGATGDTTLNLIVSTLLRRATRSRAS